MTGELMGIVNILLPRRSYFTKSNQSAEFCRFALEST